MAKKVSPMEALEYALANAHLAVQVEMAQAGGDPTARRVVEAERRMVDIATKMAPYRHPRLEVTASLPVSKPIHSYTDDELKAIILDAYERESGSVSTEASGRPGNGASMPLLEHDDVLPYGKNR
jgi:hypothetical protein